MWWLLAAALTALTLIVALWVAVILGVYVLTKAAEAGGFSMGGDFDFDDIEDEESL
jgi:hypothetical protein